MNIKKKIEAEKKENKNKGKFKDEREEYFKKEEKIEYIQKTVYITKKQDKLLRMNTALNKENHSEATRKGIDKYLSEVENLKEYLED